MQRMKVIYVHGFRSSPLSTKSRLLEKALKDYKDVDFVSPQLPPSPKEALAVLQRCCSGLPDEDICFIGSSLGGFYSTILVERNPTKTYRAFLLNPGVFPARDLAPYIGEQTYWHRPEESYSFKREYIEELKELEQELAKGLNDPSRYGGIFCKGDEVIPWTEMYGRFSGSKHLLVQEGGDHAISDFEEHMPFVLKFVFRH